MKKSLPYDKMFNVIVRKETNCKECIHYKVCRFEIIIFCPNYDSIFKGKSCLDCLHRKTYGEIPCFRCKYFRRKK